MESENLNIKERESRDMSPDNQISNLHKVTPLSKYLAMALFILMPFVGGWIGYNYAPEKVIEIDRVVVKEVEKIDEVGVGESEVVLPTKQNPEQAEKTALFSIEQNRHSDTNDWLGPKLLRKDVETDEWAVYSNLSDTFFHGGVSVYEGKIYYGLSQKTNDPETGEESDMSDIYSQDLITKEVVKITTVEGIVSDIIPTKDGLVVSVYTNIYCLDLGIGCSLVLYHIGGERGVGVEKLAEVSGSDVDVYKKDVGVVTSVRSGDAGCSSRTVAVYDGDFKLTDEATDASCYEDGKRVIIKSGAKALLELKSNEIKTDYLAEKCSVFEFSDKSNVSQCASDALPSEGVLVDPIAVYN